MYGVTIEETNSKEQTAEQHANALKREAMYTAVWTVPISSHARIRSIAGPFSSK